MAIVIPTSTISDQYLEDTADAIRDQLGSQNTYTPSQFASAIMNIAGGEAINIQSLTVTPSLSQQTFNASGVHGYKPVVVNAIPSGTAIVPASITETGANISSGTNTITLTQNVTITPTVSTGYISSGTSRVVAVSLTGSVSTKAAATITPSTSNQTIPANTFLTGIQTIAGDADLVAGNIKKGAQIFGVTGTYEGGGSSGLTLLATLSLGTISTTSTQATNTGKSVSVSGINSYDALVVETSVNTVTNNRHTATIGFIWLTASSTVGTKNGGTIATAKWNSKISSSAVTTTRASTTAYGIYPYSITISNGTATIPIYERYNSTQTGTINGAYTTRVYGLKLYDLIGG